MKVLDTALVGLWVAIGCAGFVAILKNGRERPRARTIIAGVVLELMAVFVTVILIMLFG